MKRYAWLRSRSRNARAGWWAVLTLGVLVWAIATARGELWLLVGVYAIFGVIGWFFPAAWGEPRHPRTNPRSGGFGRVDEGLR